MKKLAYGSREEVCVLPVRIVGSSMRLLPEVIHSALLVLVNLVCPPPSLSSEPVTALQGQNALSTQVPNGPLSEGRERNIDKITTERTVPLVSHNEVKERNGDPNYNGECNGIVAKSIPPGSSQVVAPSSTPALVGDRRISLGLGEGIRWVYQALPKLSHGEEYGTL